MMEITQSINTSASMEAGVLNRSWKSILFYFHKRAFEHRLAGILSAAAGHEDNSLPAGNYEYQVLAARADELCTEFAERWGLDRDLLSARIPALAKLAAMAVPPTKKYGRLALLVIIASPLTLLLLGIMAGLTSLGFHLVGGR